MLRLSELRLPLDHTDEDLNRALLRQLRIPPDHLLEQHLVKRSIDARRRDRIQLIYSLDVRVKGEAAVRRKHSRNSKIRPTPDTRYRPVATAPQGFPQRPEQRPVVVGAGPCGYFAALLLACHGRRPEGITAFYPSSVAVSEPVAGLESTPTRSARARRSVATSKMRIPASGSASHVCRASIRIRRRR